MHIVLTMLLIINIAIADSEARDQLNIVIGMDANGNVLKAFVYYICGCMQICDWIQQLQHMIVFSSCTSLVFMNNVPCTDFINIALCVFKFDPL